MPPSRTHSTKVGEGEGGCKSRSLRVAIHEPGDLPKAEAFFSARTESGRRSFAPQRPAPFPSFVSERGFFACRADGEARSPGRAGRPEFNVSQRSNSMRRLSGLGVILSTGLIAACSSSSSPPPVFDGGAGVTGGGGKQAPPGARPGRAARAVIRRAARRSASAGAGGQSSGGRGRSVFGRRGRPRFSRSRRAIPGGAGGHASAGAGGQPAGGAGGQSLGGAGGHRLAAPVDSRRAALVVNRWAAPAAGLPRPGFLLVCFHHRRRDVLRGRHLHRPRIDRLPGADLGIAWRTFGRSEGQPAPA